MTDSSITRLALREGSLPAILVAAAAAAAVAILGSVVKPEVDNPGWLAVTAVVTTIVPSIPAAIAYRRRSRRRDPAAEVTRLENGEIRRPVALIVIIAAAGITLLTAAVYFATALVSLVGIVIPLLGIILVFVSLLSTPVITAILVNRAFRRLGHYLGDHPYRATAIAVVLSTGGVFGLLSLVIMAASSSYRDANTTLGLIVGSVIFGIALLIGAELGTQHARLRQVAFVEQRLQNALVTPPDPALRRLEEGQVRGMPVRRPLRDSSPSMFPAPDPAQRRVA